MAKIVVTVDTEQDVIDVSIDGVTQVNVKEVCFYLYEDYDGDVELSTRISLLDKNKDSGITTVTQLIAKDTADAKKALEAGAQPCKANSAFVQTKNYVNGDVEKAKADIATYFSKTGLI